MRVVSRRETTFRHADTAAINNYRVGLLTQVAAYSAAFFFTKFECNYQNYFAYTMVDSLKLACKTHLPLTVRCFLTEFSVRKMISESKYSCHELQNKDFTVNTHAFSTRLILFKKIMRPEQHSNNHK